MSFADDVCRWTALFRTASRRDHAVGTEFIAANHDSNESLKWRWSHFRVAKRIVALEAIRDFFTRAFTTSQTDGLYLSSFGRITSFPNQTGNLSQLSSSHDKVDVRSFLKDQILILLGHAAHYANHLLRPSSLAELQAAQSTVDLVLRVFTHAAGIEQNRVGFFGIVRQFVTIFAQRGNDQFAVQHVHLAANSFDIKSSVMLRVL